MKKSEGKMKCFWDKQPLKGFAISRTGSRETLKEYDIVSHSVRLVKV